MIFPAGGCYKFRTRYSGGFLGSVVPNYRFYMIFMHACHTNIDFSGFLRILEVLPGVVTNCRSVLPNFRRAAWIQIWFLEEVQEGRVFRPGPDGTIKLGHLISGDVSVKWDLFKVGTRIGPERSTKIQKSKNLKKYISLVVSCKCVVSTPRGWCVQNNEFSLAEDKCEYCIS